MKAALISGKHCNVYLTLKLCCTIVSWCRTCDEIYDGHKLKFKALTASVLSLEICRNWISTEFLRKGRIKDESDLGYLEWHQIWLVSACRGVGGILSSSLSPLPTHIFLTNQQKWELRSAWRLSGLVETRSRQLVFDYKI